LYLWQSKEIEVDLVKIRRRKVKEMKKKAEMVDVDDCRMYDVMT